MRRGYRRPPFLTIGVWCSWLHSANCKLSIKVLVSAFFVCVWILHVSADICMFLMFAANSLRVGRRWQSANIIAKNASEMHQQLSTYRSKFIPNPLNIRRNGAQERSESDLGSKAAKRCHRLMLFWWFFCITWAILGAILVPAERQGAPKIELFGIKSH